MKVNVPRLLSRLGVEPTSTGVETWARCPFPDHEDKTPSFQIHDEDGDEKHAWFQCFGCGRKGGAAQLVMGLLKIDLDGAFRWLRENDVSARDLAPLSLRVKSSGSLYGASFKIPRDVFFGDLAEWPGPPRSYLLGRGVTPEQVERWRIGYAVSGFLKHRVVFPKRDATGKAVGYTARTYLKREEKRYLEPSEKDGADPHAVWGEELWPAGDRGTVVVTEGALDVLAVERVCPPHWSLAAITGASRTSRAVLQKLSTFSRVLVVTDADQAGERAAEAIREGCAGSEVIRVNLGDHDANELERQDSAELKRLLVAR